jgi:hypothetical protein
MKGIKYISLLLMVACITCTPIPKSYTTLVHLKQEITRGGKARIIEKKEKVAAEIELIEKSRNVRNVIKITDYQMDEMIENSVISPDGEIFIYQLKQKERVWNLWGVRIADKMSISEKIKKERRVLRIKSALMEGITKKGFLSTHGFYPDVIVHADLLAHTLTVPPLRIPQRWTIKTTELKENQLIESVQAKWSADREKIL